MDNHDRAIIKNVKKEERKYRNGSNDDKWYAVFAMAREIKELDTSKLREILNAVQNLKGKFTLNFERKLMLAEPERWVPIVLEFVDFVELLEHIDKNLPIYDTAISYYERGSANRENLQYGKEIYESIRDSVAKTIELATKQGCKDPVIINGIRRCDILQKLHNDEELEDQIAIRCFNLPKLKAQLRYAFIIGIKEDVNLSTLPINVTKHAQTIAFMMRLLVSHYVQKCLSVPQYHKVIIRCLKN